MALKILQPGFVPLGQFDLKASSTILGGECVVLSQSTSDGGAKDATQWMNTASTEAPMFELGGPHDTPIDSAGGSATVGPTGSAAETYRSVLAARSATGMH